MATTDAAVVQDLLNKIGKLITEIDAACDLGRDRIKDVKTEEVKNAIANNEWNLDLTKWNNLDEAGQNKLYNRLKLMDETLVVISELDGSRDPKSMMYPVLAKNCPTMVWMLVGFILVAGLLWAIYAHWNRATGTDFGQKNNSASLALEAFKVARDNAKTADTEEMEAYRKVEAARNDTVKLEAQKIFEDRIQQSTKQHDQLEKAQQTFAEAAAEAMQSDGVREDIVLLMVILLGALGGSLHFIGSLVKYIGNRKLKRSWLPHYLAMPIVGAALAPIVYMLLRIGLVNPTGVSGDGSGIANLNLIAIYAFAALSGLFSKTATEKLSEVFSTLFRTQGPDSKDSLGNGKSS